MIEIDELIDDAREYDDFNTQVDEEMATYKDDEMLEGDGRDKVDVEVCSVTDVMDVCGSKPLTLTQLIILLTLRILLTLTLLLLLLLTIQLRIMKRLTGLQLTRIILTMTLLSTMKIPIMGMI